MNYYEVKIRDKASLVPRNDGSIFWPDKHGKLIRVDVFKFSKKQLDPKGEKLTPKKLGFNAAQLIRKYYEEHYNFGDDYKKLDDIYPDLKSIKKIDRAKFDKRKSLLIKNAETSSTKGGIITENKSEVSKPISIDKTNNIKTSPEKRLFFKTVAGSVVFFGLQFAVSPMASAVLLIIGLIIGPILVGILISIALAEKDELNNKPAGIIAAAIFALICFLLLKSDLIDEARNAGSGGGSLKSCIQRNMSILNSTKDEALLHCKKVGF